MPKRRAKMPPKSRAEKLEEIRSRTVGGQEGGILDPKTTALEAEANRIRRSMDKGAPEEYVPTPGEQAEAEFRRESGTAAPQPIVGPDNQPTRGNRVSPEDLERKAAELVALAKKTREQEARPPQNQTGKQVHTAQFVDIVDGAYRDFLRRGVGPETACSLVQAYCILEVGDVLARIERIVGTTP